MEDSAIIFGVDPERENIGAAIHRRLASVMRAAGLDLYDTSDIPTVNEFLTAEWKHLVVSCGMISIKPFEEQLDVDLYRVIDANLSIPMILAHRFVQAILLKRIENGNGQDISNIIFIGSYAHNHVLSDSAAYCAAKAGLHMLGKCLAWELTGKGFNVFTVHPHSVQNTPMTAEVIEALMENKNLDRAGAEAYWKQNLRLSERLRTDDVAQVVKGLITSGQRHMSGSAIELYGGER